MRGGLWRIALTGEEEDGHCEDPDYQAMAKTANFADDGHDSDGEGIEDCHQWN